MDQLHRQVRRARRRLVLQSFLARLAWCWFVALVGCAAAILAGKFWPLADQTAWAAGWALAALGAGALAAAVWTWLARCDALDAALEIDRRFGLKERVSSTLALSAEELETEVGQALARDAARRLERIDVPERFGVRLNRRALLPLAPAAVAVALALGMHGRSPQAPAATTAEQQTRITKSTEALAKKLEDKRKQAAEAGLEEFDALLKQMQAGAKQLAEKPPADRKKTLVALNDLVKDAQRRRKEIAGAAELKQQLGQLKNLKQGPAQQLASALKTGDLKKAIAELDKLTEQLAAEKLDEKQRELLARQLDELREALQKTVEAHRKTQQELERQIERARSAGNLAQADKLAGQLEKLTRQAPQIERLSRLAQQLKNASQCANQGDCQQAADALGRLSNELAGMQLESAELEMLDEALAEFSDAKSSMNCAECEGEGCAACQGGAMRFADRWMRSDMARGAGRGAGDRDEQKTDTGFYDSQVKQNVRKGAVVVTGTADGPNRKGQVQQAINDEFANTQQQAAEALSGQRLPRDYRDHAKRYFDTLREGR